MADDIDIEEHDVLENPIIKSIFPDISVLKKEISVYYEDEPNIKKEPDIRNNEEKLNTPGFPAKDIENADVFVGQLSKLHCSLSADTPSVVHANKIILGSKPSKPVKLTNSVETNVKKLSNISLAANETPKLIIQENKLNMQKNVHKRTSTKIIKPVDNSFDSAKIILGSKPNISVQQENDFDTSIKKRPTISLDSVVRLPKVLLQDLGEYIFHSNRYCKACKTLFPTKVDFYDHKEKFNCSNERNQTTIVTSSLNKNDDANLSKNITNEVSTSKVQNESAVRTRNKTLNVKVTLEKAEPDKIINKCILCKSNFSNKLNLHKHFKNVHKKKMSFRPTNKNQTLACNICGSQFSSTSSLSRHCKNIHYKTKVVIQHKHNNDCSIKPASAVSTSGKKCTQNKHVPSKNKNGENSTKTRKNNLNVKVTQERSKVREKNNKCTICSSYFSNGPNLRRHYKNIHKIKISLTQNVKQKSIETNLVNNKSRETPNPRINNETTSRNAKKSCFHCNEKFSDQESLIEHMYKVLEPKENPNKTRGKTAKKLRKSATIMMNDDTFQNKYDMTKKLKDKLIFEHEDSEEEQILNDSETGLSETLIISDTLAPEKKLMRLHTKKGSQDSRSSVSARKELDYDSDSDMNVFESLETNETCKNHATLVTKKRKLVMKNSDPAESEVMSKRTKLGSRIRLGNVKDKSIKPKIAASVSKDESNLSVTTDADSLETVYECIYCSYTLPTARAYYLHVLGKHKVEKISRVNKVIFDKQCKYCPSKNYNGKARNKHISTYHRGLLTKDYKDEREGSGSEEETRTYSEGKKVREFVLKSIVYKCIKCDIHFLSSCVAKDHEKHMELLVNWKCSICKKIFKRHDKYLHLKQHKLSKTVNVCQFNQTELSRLLYNCTKCAIHFTEERYLEHYSKCEIHATDSVYCKDCDILIDKHEYGRHKTYHSMGKHSEDFIIMVEDIITASKSQESDVAKKRTRRYEQMNCLTFCETCKCYLSDIAVAHKAHVELRCSTIVRYTCVLCGLVFTNKSINTHRQNHKKQKDLKLQDFKFFDLKGIQICPPVPEYPRCNNCEVIFVSKNAVKNHICSEMDYLVCKICNVKLSENAFKLHMNFHSYIMPHVSAKQLKKQYIKAQKCIQSSQNLEDKLKINNDTNVSNDIHQRKKNLITLDLENTILETDNTQTDIMLTKSKKSITKPDESTKTLNTESVKNNLDIDASQVIGGKDSKDKNCTTICNLELRDKEQNAQTITSLLSSASEDNDTSLSSEAKPQILNKDKTDKNSANHNLIYTCLSCGIAIDTYDKVVQHCQSYYSPLSATTAILKKCSKCSLKFDIDTYENHQKSHLVCDNDNMQILVFDPTYFTADNKIWTRHIFASVTPTIQREVITKSMYQHECRIKMEIVQRGASHLTVYKCCKCGNFIDPDCLLLHIKEGTLQGGPVGCHKKMKRYPCSTCGLPLISSDYRIKHERIHKQYENVRLKSYNVILINCETHRNFNANIINATDKYVVYQCRVCNGIVDKLQHNDHKCIDDDDLQKCEICGLITSKDDVLKHVSKHTDLPFYTVDNIKVVLFGNAGQPVQNKTVVPSFSGTICDYKLYICNKCEVCVNDKKSISRHTCTIDDSKWKCPKCGFYISNRSIKQHIKQHDLDAEFKMENFDVIYFGLNKSIACEEAKEAGDTSEKLYAEVCDTEKTPQFNDITNNSENISNKERDVEFVALYKCACGLHYMDENNAKDHARRCPTKVKIIRQNCSKCDLVFNPKELFSHIIAHHSDKSKTLQYDVIDLSPEEKDKCM